MVWPKGKPKSPEIRKKISLRQIGKKLSQEHREHISQALREHYSKRTAELRSQALREYYQEHQVWNKGRPWPEEIREKIREGCLNSEIGMGPKSETEEKEVLV